jgi:hypothetical protein
VSATATLRRREVVLDDLTGLAAISAIARLRELELRPAVEPCDTDRLEQHGFVVAHDPSADCQVRRAQVITLLVGQHVEAGAHPPPALEDPALTTVDAHRSAEMVRPARPTAPFEALGVATTESVVRPRPTPPVSAAPIPHVAEPRTSALDHDVPIDPPDEQTLHIASHQEREGRLQSTRRRHPRRRLLASASLCLSLAATALLMDLRAVDGPAANASHPAAPPSRSASPTHLKVEPALPSRAPVLSRIPKRRAPVRTTHDHAAPAVARGHPVAAKRERAPVSPKEPTRVVPASAETHAPDVSAGASPTPSPALPPSPTGDLPGPPPT